MIFSDFSKALGQLGDARFRKVLLLGLALTIGLLVGLTVLLVFLLGLVLPETVSLPWIGDIAWLDSLASWALVGVMLVLSPFLMVPVSVTFMGIFLDQVAEAVEERHYPQLPPAQNVTVMDGLRDSLGLILATVLVNILALGMSFFIGPLAPILFWIVNGYLIGREFFQLAAMRREGRVRANQLRRKHNGQIWLAGTLMAIPLTIPLVGLVIPILGAATFTHLYHRVTGTVAR
ncbi:EI24 domain-containing protein [Maritimibacter sp. DP1N21-5]|uniref:EI24 domain-containing protein n=1 Tax=Maritimibacter sp. DP1N21-5 TaxID=2836867 RepID=UPI001C47CC9E|nr:EI24 domain-containing protein [Maritimibacter sp. DP1N21-5]MBV7408038.1 EI24 domain-containing protein [Maritimibacter sp. DP1N21-5]